MAILYGFLRNFFQTGISGNGGAVKRGNLHNGSIQHPGHRLVVMELDQVVEYWPGCNASYPSES